MTTNYYLLISGDMIVGPGSQPAMQTQTTTDPETGQTTTIDVPLPLPANCIPCTQTQAETWQTLEFVGGVLQAIPAAMLLSQAQAAQKVLLRASCVSAIVSGFVSSALGSAYTYPSTLTDQHNLSGSVVASLLPNLPSTWTTPFWVMDSTSAWSFAPHTAAQIQQAGLDGKAWITTCQQKKTSLDAQIDAATTVSAVQSVVWL